MSKKNPPRDDECDCSETVPGAACMDRFEIHALLIALALEQNLNAQLRGRLKELGDPWLPRIP